MTGIKYRHPRVTGEYINYLLRNVTPENCTGDVALNRFLMPAAFLLTALITGCAIVTTYGKDPEKLDKNTYKFKLYYNVASTDKDIDKKAQEIK